MDRKIRTSTRWTQDEDNTLLVELEKCKVIFPNHSDKEIFSMLETDLPNRTRKSIELRYYYLKNRQPVKAEPNVKESQFDTFLRSIENMKIAYDELLSNLKQSNEDNLNLLCENETLKIRINELEQEQQDYQALVRVMEKARKIVANEMLGEVEKPRFKMDTNGNLNRI